MQLPKVSFIPRKALVNRLIHLVLSGDLASVFHPLPELRKLRNLMDG